MICTDNYPQVDLSELDQISEEWQIKLFGTILYSANSPTNNNIQPKSKDEYSVNNNKNEHNKTHEIEKNKHNKRINCIFKNCQNIKLAFNIDDTDKEITIEKSGDFTVSDELYENN